MTQTSPSPTGSGPAAYIMVDARNLNKDYSGQTQPALEDFSLTIPEGQIFGLIGANGAGKTSLLKILATLIKHDKGEAYVAGYSVKRNPQEVRRIVVYMPDNYGLYQDMQVEEYLDFFAACYGIRGKKRSRLINELLELVDLGDRRKEVLGNLSRGMKQRLCLAHTLVHDPKLLLLDEPSSGLDPRARVELRELLRELSYMGKTIILSSHVLGEVQLMCDWLGIMARGQLISYGPAETVVNQIEALPRRAIKLRVVSQADLKRAAELAAAFSGLLKGSLRVDDLNLTLDVVIDGDDRTSAAFLTHLTISGVFVAQYGQSTARLEELFLRN